MKIVYFARIGCICLALSMAACSSGGGDAVSLTVPLASFAGGAASTGNAETPTDVLGVGVAAGLGTPNTADSINGFVADMDFGPLGSGTPESITLDLSGGELTVRSGGNPIKVISADDLTMFDNGLAGMVLKENMTIAELDGSNPKLPGVTGPVKGTNALVIGKAGLQYANFGFWELKTHTVGKFDDGRNFNNYYSAYEPFTLVAASANKINPTTAETFTGQVVANAYDYENIAGTRSVDLVGTADLTMTSGNAGTITLGFDNFYTLGADIDVTDGDITQSGSFAISDSVKNTTGIRLTGGGGGSLTGQFYGAPAALVPTEAVGVFDYKSLGRDSGVRGSFGVK